MSNNLVQACYLRKRIFTMGLNSAIRKLALGELGDKIFDIIIIGGGVTGCGIALDGASRGLDVLLLEKEDFASGTSSKSTKLIHGGLRYLKQLDFWLVRESGLERAIVNKLAPHLCLPEKMLLPLVEDGTYGKFAASFGLWLYDFLADVDGDDKRRILSKQESLKKEPLLNPDKLVGAGYYAEYRTDDARLTIEIAKKAHAYGATVLNYAHVDSFTYSGDRINGVQFIDRIDGITYKACAHQVISAAGPWVDELRKKNNSLSGKRLRLTKGVHIVFDRERLPLNQSVYFDVADGRMVFAIPRGKSTYVGTTDTFYEGSKNRVVATKADRDYLLAAANAAFPGLSLMAEDVKSNWAGLRPLIHEDGKAPSELSRKDEIFVAADGLISIAGGKLTGYRKMAERLIERTIENKLITNGRKIGTKTITDSIALTPQPLHSNKEVTEYISEVSTWCLKKGLSKDYGYYLVTNYGRQCEQILNEHSLEGVDHTEQALLRAEITFCINHEAVCRASDFVVRRTGRLYFDITSVLTHKDFILKTMASVLKWSDQRLYDERRLLDELIYDATHYYDEELMA